MIEIKNRKLEKVKEFFEENNLNEDHVYLFIHDEGIALVQGISTDLAEIIDHVTKVLDLGDNNDPLNKPLRLLQPEEEIIPLFDLNLLSTLHEARTEDIWDLEEISQAQIIVDLLVVCYSSKKRNSMYKYLEEFCWKILSKGEITEDPCM